MDFSLDSYLAKGQQTPVKAAWETGGFSLDRHISAPKGGAWDIRRDRRGQRSATVSGGAPTSNAPAGSAAASYQRQTVPEDLRARLEQTPDRQTVPAAQPMTLYELQNPKWKRVMQDMTDPVSAFGLTEKQAWELNIRALERKLSDAEGKLEALRESEQKAQDWVDAARFHAADDYDQAERPLRRPSPCGKRRGSWRRGTERS